MLIKHLASLLYSLACVSQTSALVCPGDNSDRPVCTPTSAGSALVDDVPAIQDAIESCGDGGVITIPSGTTFSIRSPLDFGGCVYCDFQIEGTLLISDDVDYWSSHPSIMVVSGVQGLSMYSQTGSGVIDGNGQAAWDAFAADDSLSRPVLHAIQGASREIRIYDLTIRNAPMFFFTVGGRSSGVTYQDLQLSAVSTSSNVAKNTDGIDIGDASYVTVSSCTITNDDDCVAFKPGSNWVIVNDVTCYGSHGISVGSLGKAPGSTDTVSNIMVQNVMMHNSTKAVGIKLWPGGPKYGTAVVSNVTFDDVQVDNADYAAQIDTCYGEGEAYCAAHPSTAQLSNIGFLNFQGTTSTHHGSVVASLDCSAQGTCDIAFQDWSVRPSTGQGQVVCANVPDDAGITCGSSA
ncbi:hypothetical protein ANO11243_071630 [Dothideomycetidae sp. 11243]|nr:hypothetical protein ANO11243_071630 [fungal sp. No.11243]